MVRLGAGGINAGLGPHRRGTEAVVTAAYVSRMLEGLGVKISLIQHGDRKSDYSPFKPLSDEAREKIHDDVDAIGALFCETVARNRGMSTKAVRSTEAGIYMGSKAVSVGFLI